MVQPTARLCKHMANPMPDTAKHLRHMIMHMDSHPESNCYGGWGKTGLESTGELIAPYTPGQKNMSYEFFSDANLEIDAMTGDVGMLAGGPIQARSGRQHLKAPSSHGAEVVAATDNLNAVVPVNGLLQEL